ncbi:hypothetical protein [Streptomyces cinereoruber]|uniref:hypothetical protein n=1 Tax=Streptomyces cinereoruber TaxID=67260 RepID=UPI0036BDE2E3
MTPSTAPVRRTAEDQAVEQDRSGMTVPRRDITAVVRDQAGPTTPGSAAGREHRRT